MYRGGKCASDSALKFILNFACKCIWCSMCMCDKDERNARNVVKEPEVEEGTSI